MNCGGLVRAGFRHDCDNSSMEYMGEVRQFLVSPLATGMLFERSAFEGSVIERRICRGLRAALWRGTMQQGAVCGRE